jgi:DNA-binding CsgD family transcriptional regulator
MTLQGNSVDNIAYMLNISPHTVRVHMRNAYSKLRVRNRLELFAMFLRQAGFKGKSRT